jgi:hypothetical protein
MERLKELAKEQSAEIFRRGDRLEWKGILWAIYLSVDVGDDLDRAANMLFDYVNELMRARSAFALIENLQNFKKNPGKMYI